MDLRKRKKNLAGEHAGHANQAGSRTRLDGEAWPELEPLFQFSRTGSTRLALGEYSSDLFFGGELATLSLCKTFFHAGHPFFVPGERAPVSYRVLNNLAARHRGPRGEHVDAAAEVIGYVFVVAIRLDDRFH
jgi:hypothetical protein